MTSQVTQCPKCHTSFRVTETQLNIANGAVRCGSCLHIFNASDHWLDTTTIAPSPQPSSSSLVIEAYGSEQSSSDAPNNQDAATQDTEELFTDTVEQSVLDNIFDDDIFADDLLADELSDSDDINENSPGTNNDEELSLDDDGDDLIYETSSRPIIEHDAAMISADDLAFDDVEESQNTDTDFSDTFLNLDNMEASPSSVYKDLDDLGEHSATEEDWAKKLLEEDDNVEPEEELSQTNTVDEYPDIFDALETPDSPLDPALLNIVDEQDQDVNQEPIPEDEFILGNEPMLAGERFGEDKLALLANIEPEPVEISSAETRNIWIQRTWIASIAAVTLLLAGQYIAFNFDHLSRHDSYRPLLATTCSVLGCQLPGLYNINLIHPTNLIVRSHRSTKQALVVDAIITNRASFKQRFPMMELQFTDLSGKVIAGRRFSPEEYLGGELAGIQMMPIAQPIHISLEIVDPGKQAVSYQLSLHPQRDS
ncbi:MAG: DUF3426 domain-containing protein [Pseudomonadales bacterium]